MVEKIQIDFDSILPRFLTDRGRAGFIYNAAENGLQVPEKCVDWALDFYLSPNPDVVGEEAGRPRSQYAAARLFGYVGQYEKSISIWEELEEWDNAIETAEEAGMEERKQQIVQKLIDDDVEKKNFQDAGETAKKHGRADEARKYFSQFVEELGDSGDPGALKLAGYLCREELGDPEKSKEFYNRAVDIELEKGEDVNAARTAREGNLERAEELYFGVKGELIMEKQFDVLAGLADFFRRTDEAIESLEMAGKHRQAAEMAEKRGRKEWAIEIYLRDHSYYFAVPIMEELGQFERGARVSAENGNFMTGMHLAEKSNNPELVKEIARKGMEKAEKDGQFDVAMEYAKGGGFGDLAEFYSDMENLKGQIEPSEEM